MNKNEIWKSYRFPLILLGGIFLGALIGVIWGKQAAVLKPLGDIFINVQAIRDQAKEYGHSLRREACFLFCHGLLHLMGYDHMEPEEEKVMFELQDVILDEVVSR